MVKLIVGSKGFGKTKMMVEMINEAAKVTKGSIVCIEKSMKLTYDIDHAVRLIDVDEYGIKGYDQFIGFFAGILAGNYDITEVYVDGILRIGNDDIKDIEGLGRVLDAIAKLAGDNVKAIMTVSTEVENLTEQVKKYL